MSILANKFYNEESVFKPENLLREARRQKGSPNKAMPPICLLDPDGDLTEYLKTTNKATMNSAWACYHSKLFDIDLGNGQFGIIPYVVGAPYAVLVAEQLFMSGCQLLISLSSAGTINEPPEGVNFVLITEAVRDEGTSYHYLPPEDKAKLQPHLIKKIDEATLATKPPFTWAKSWTTDAPYRETPSAIASFAQQGITCVEMEAAALYAFGQANKRDILCFAHITNSMAQDSGDFEKGEYFGSLDALNLIQYVLSIVK